MLLSSQWVSEANGRNGWKADISGPLPANSIRLLNCQRGLSVRAHGRWGTDATYVNFGRAALGQCQRLCGGAEYDARPTDLRTSGGAVVGWCMSHFTSRS